MLFRVLHIVQCGGVGDGVGDCGVVGGLDPLGGSVIRHKGERAVPPACGYVGFWRTCVHWKGLDRAKSVSRGSLPVRRWPMCIHGAGLRRGIALV